MRWIVFILIVVAFGCDRPSKNQERKIIDWKDHWEKPKERNLLLSKKWLHPRVKDCLKDTSVIVLTSLLLTDSMSFLPVKNLGDINGDFLNDSILVIPELFITTTNSFESGASIIFTNPEIPRIKVDQTCVSVNFVFPVADIDEDGVIEIGKYYTSCASRSKKLELLTLSENSWKTAGAVNYDAWYAETSVEDRIRKIGKHEFQMREVTERIDQWRDFRLD